MLWRLGVKKVGGGFYSCLRKILVNIKDMYLYQINKRCHALCLFVSGVFCVYCVVCEVSLIPYCLFVEDLVAIFEEMFEFIEHRICLRHLYTNFRKKTWWSNYHNESFNSTILEARDNLSIT